MLEELTEDLSLSTTQAEQRFRLLQVTAGKELAACPALLAYLDWQVKKSTQTLTSLTSGDAVAMKDVVLRQASQIQTYKHLYELSTNHVELMEAYESIRNSNISQ